MKGKVHIDAPLSNIAVRGFASGMDQFIAPMIFPVVPVNKQSNVYYEIEKQAFLRHHNTQRAPKTKAKRIEFSVSSDTYFAHNYALSTDEAIETIDNADSAIGIREGMTDLVVTGLARDYEVRVANKITSISNVGSGVSLSGSNKWSDYVSSDPVADVTTGHAFMRQQTGLKPNTAIIDTDTLAILRRHPALLDMYKYTEGGELTDAQLASLFKVARILEGTAIYDQNNEGGTASHTNVWGNNCVLAHIKPASNMKTVTFGLGFRWSPAGFPAPMQVARQQFTGPGTENIEVLEAQMFQDEKIVAQDLAYAITSTL